MSGNTVTITEKHYAELCAAERKLDALEAMGVDNWEGYGEAMGLLSDDEEDLD